MLADQFFSSLQDQDYENHYLDYPKVEGYKGKYDDCYQSDGQDLLEAYLCSQQESETDCTRFELEFATDEGTSDPVSQKLDNQTAVEEDSESDEEVEPRKENVPEEIQCPKLGEFYHELRIFHKTNTWPSEMSEGFRNFISFKFGRDVGELIREAQSCNNSTRFVTTDSERGAGERRRDEVIKAAMTTLKALFYTPFKTERSKVKKSDALKKLGLRYGLAYDAKDKNCAVNLWFGCGVKHGLKNQTIRMLFASPAFLSAMTDLENVKQLITTMHKATDADIMTNIIKKNNWKRAVNERCDIRDAKRERSQRLPMTYLCNLVAVRTLYEELLLKMPADISESAKAEQRSKLQKVIAFVDETMKETEVGQYWLSQVAGTCQTPLKKAKICFKVAV